MIILIKGGRVINPATKMDEVADVLIENEKVIDIQKEIDSSADRIIDAKDCYVMPGFIDMHVHFRDPGLEYKEDIFTGMAAAAHGGYTSVLCMPNTKPVADNPDVIEYVHRKALNGDCINVYQVGAVTKGQQGKELSQIEAMVEAGCPAISEDGKSVMDSNLYRQAMEIAARLDIPVLAHCEDINLVNGGVMNLDEKSKECDMPGISNAVEDIIVARDILLAKETGAPPLRTKEDVEALKQGIKDGIMEVISTDHAPHAFDEKNTSMKKAPFGIVGLETAACLTYSELVLGGYITPMQMAECMSYNPARIMKFDAGDIQPGKVADVVIFNPKEKYVIDKEKFASKGRNTPFDGREVIGKVKYTICRGKVVYDDKNQ